MHSFRYTLKFQSLHDLKIGNCGRWPRRHTKLNQNSHFVRMSSYTKFSFSSCTCHRVHKHQKYCAHHDIIIKRRRPWCFCTCTAHPRHRFSLALSLSGFLAWDGAREPAWRKRETNETGFDFWIRFRWILALRGNPNDFIPLSFYRTVVPFWGPSNVLGSTYSRSYKLNLPLFEAPSVRFPKKPFAGFERCEGQLHQRHFTIVHYLDDSDILISIPRLEIFSNSNLFENFFGNNSVISSTKMMHVKLC